MEARGLFQCSPPTATAAHDGHDRLDSVASSTHSRPEVGRHPALGPAPCPVCPSARTGKIIFATTMFWLLISMPLTIVTSVDWSHRRDVHPQRTPALARLPARVLA